MRIFTRALKLFLLLTLLTGGVYPLFVTFIAQITMKETVDGKILYKDGKPFGAELIGQKFEANRYFWGRPSAVGYNTMPSGASNLSPTSKVLKGTVEERKNKLARIRGDSSSEFPSELVFASASGIDPHISPQTAYYQIPRIMKERSLDPKKIDLKDLIDQATIPRTLGFLGKPCVNVLLLNRSLDEKTANL